MEPKRYAQLLQLIAYYKPQTILEIGTWNGERALLLCKEALKHQKSVAYYGYDLFEDGDPATDKEELNVKMHHHVEVVTKKLHDFQKTYPGFSFNLIKGNTRQTLKDTAVDFVWLDGGHSVKTIESDLDNLKSSKVVALDDYYVQDQEGKCPDLELYGCNRPLDAANLDYILLPIKDSIVQGGLVQIALISKVGYPS